MKTNDVRPIDANALLDAMPKSDVLLRHQVVDVICNSPSIDVALVITGETSDGYHTFNELYHHRAVLFSVIIKAFPDRAWKARKHHDGSMYDGMFIVGIETPDGQATYHYDIEPYWDMFNCKELEYAPEWDGHTPDEAIRRIGNLKLVQDVQAHWILLTDEYGESFIQCSHCKECWHVSDYCKSDELYLDDLLHSDMIYCPSCGAKMDDDDENAHDV